MRNAHLFCQINVLLLLLLTLFTYRHHDSDSAGVAGTLSNTNTNTVRHDIQCQWTPTTVVPALGDPRRERPPAVYGHFVNVPTHFNVNLPLISGHLPNADSHLLVVSTCYNGQCKQMPRFRWSFQPKIAGAHPNLGPTVRSNFRAVVW